MKNDIKTSCDDDKTPLRKGYIDMRVEDMRQDFVHGVVNKHNGEIEYLPSLQQLSDTYKFPFLDLQAIADSEDWKAKKDAFWAGATSSIIGDNFEIRMPQKRENGKFAKGGGGGPGRGHSVSTHGSTITMLRERIYALWRLNPEAFERAMALILLKAAQGDFKAAEFIFAHILPKDTLKLAIDMGISQNPFESLDIETQKRILENRLNRLNALDNETNDVE
jgi:hypothetical protein